VERNRKRKSKYEAYLKKFIKDWKAAISPAIWRDSDEPKRRGTRNPVK
jgi:hypothetical protein